MRHCAPSFAARNSPLSIQRRTVFTETLQTRATSSIVSSGSSWRMTALAIGFVFIELAGLAENPWIGGGVQVFLGSATREQADEGA